ncbi:MAG: ABC transporter permease, partial [Acidobacteriota bacterium]
PPADHSFYDTLSRSGLRYSAVYIVVRTFDYKQVVEAMFSRIAEIVKKEIHVTWREPKMRFVILGPPLIQLLIFGYAANMDIEDSRLAWMDRDQTTESRALLAEFQGSRHFHITALPPNEAELGRLLDGGKVDLAVRVLPGFSRHLRRGRQVAVQILVDGTNSNSASILAGYANQVVRRFAQSILRPGEPGSAVAAAVDNPGSSGRPLVVTASRIWFNANLRSQDYFVPGVVVNIIGLVTMMLTAMAIVREKEIGTMEQLMVTPIRPVELMLGKTIPSAVVGLLEMVLVTGAALLVFDIPFRGSPMLLLISSILFILTTLGAGLFMSTVSATQQQAMMGSFFFFMPAFLLSGFAFPIRNMPAAVQYLTYLNPMRYFIEIVRGIFLKGTGLAVVWPQMAALCVLGALMFGLSAWRFQKRLE